LDYIGPMYGPFVVLCEHRNKISGFRELLDELVMGCAFLELTASKIISGTYLTFPITILALFSIH
jgi:hypothetical protein